MVEDKYKTCSTCIKADICPHKEHFITATKKALDMENHNVLIKVTVECRAYAPITESVRIHKSDVCGRF